MRIKVQRVTAPGSEPVLLSTAKDHLRVDHSAEDDLIQAYLAAAREHAEQYCNRSWAQADFFVLFEDFPGSDSPLVLPDPGISAISGVSYIDSDGTEQTIAGSGYSYDEDRQELRPSDNWPTDAVSIKVNYTAGADASSSPAEYVPEAVKNAILLLAADFYEVRMTQLVGQSLSENPAAKMLLNPHRVEMGV